MKDKAIMLLGLYMAYASHQATLGYLYREPIKRENPVINRNEEQLEERLKEILRMLEMRDKRSLESSLGFRMQEGKYVRMLARGTAYETPAYFVKGKEKGKTAFVMAPHGDEPAAWMAALDISGWGLEHGNMIVVPRADRRACESRVRCSGSDLNRQFGERKSNDPAYALATEIKNLIKESGASLVLNLHEGHGYYLEDSARWGQTIATDSMLYKNKADRIVRDVNRRLSGRMRFTPVCKPMETTLTYYCMSRGIPAYGLETSKNLSDSESRELLKELVAAFLTSYEMMPGRELAGK